MIKFNDLVNCGYSIKIPSYQRAYAWGETQIKQFVNDLIEIGNKSYYYGHFILEDNEKDEIYEDEIYEVVDGQQRITTYVLFILSAKLYSNYTISEEQKDFIQKKFKTISYDANRFKKLTEGILNKNELIELSDQDTSSIRRIHKAIESFKEILSKKDLQIDPAINALINAEISVHKTKDKKLAVQIFELQNSRGISLSLIEKVKSRLMKEIYLYSDENNSEKNIKTIQDNFSEIYQLEESTAESRFRGELKLDNILYHHLRVIDDRTKKEEKDLHSPSKNNEEGILEYIGNKLNGKTNGQEKVNYILALSEYFKESVKYVCKSLIEKDKDNPLVGDCLILERAISLEFFLILLHNDKFQGVDLKKWELLLFTRDFHVRYHRKVYKDNFQWFYGEILKNKDNKYVNERLNHFIKNGFRGKQDGYKLQEAFNEDTIKKSKNFILNNAYHWWKEKMTYLLYKYEIEKNGNDLREKIRKYFKKGKSIEHILPQNWTNLEKKSTDIEEFRNKINGIINGIGNLIIIDSSENSSNSDKHPNKKEYSIEEGSYEIKKEWEDHTKWEDLIKSRGNDIFRFMEKYFSVDTSNDQ